MREIRTYGLRRQEKENGDRRTARCVKDTHTQPSSAVLFRLTAPSLDPTVGMGFTLDDMEPIHEGGEWKRSIARRVRRDKKNRSKKHEEGL